MTAPLILVVDDDKDIVRLVGASLHSQGYEVVSAADGSAALEIAAVRKPDLVISDVMMPGMDGWELVKQLRSRPHFALIPVILLTALGAESDRIRGFRLGADDYLPKPFHLGELSARVAKALKHRAQLRNILRLKAPAARPHAPPGFHGTLDQIGVATLLGVLDLERKTGVLTLSAAAASTGVGHVHVRDGRVMSVTLDGPSRISGEDALGELLEWAAGEFDYTPGDVPEGAGIGMSTTQLLMTVAKRVDEARRGAVKSDAGRNLDASDSIRPHRAR